MKRLLVISLLVFIQWPLYSRAVSVTTTICDDFGVCKTTYAVGNPVTRQIEVRDRLLYNKLKGRFVMTVENAGERYYVSPDKPVIYFLGNANHATQLLYAQGRGVSTYDISRLKVGIAGMYGKDADFDGLSDNFETAIGTNRHNFNSDKDVHSDFIEIINGYTPLGAGRLPVSMAYAKEQAGRVLLQTDLNGEAWYVNPIDNKRYYLGSSYFVNDLLNKFSIGISNKDFNDLIK